MCRAKATCVCREIGCRSYDLSHAKVRRLSPQILVLTFNDPPLIDVTVVATVTLAPAHEAKMNV